MSTESISQLATAVTCTTPVLDILDWDSKLFGVRIARVTGHELDQQKTAAIRRAMREESIECAYFLADPEPDTIRTAESNGFQLVDIRVTLAARLLENYTGPWQGDGVRESEHTDIPALREIAAQSHTDTRFYRDGRFERKQCDELYRTWITKSCHGYADIVMVAEHESRPVGYVTCHLKEDGSGEIGLMGVDSSVRKLGLGEKLVRRALCWFHEREAQDVTVVTQGSNIAAQRLYQRCGFASRALQLWFHCWPLAQNGGNPAC